jgi:hypothetical protein
VSCDELVLFDFACGEDLVVQFVWLDENSGTPIPFQTPAVLTMADLSGNEVMVFHDHTWEGINPAADPFLLVSPDEGVIQATAPAVQTLQLYAGSYNMDLWVYTKPVVGGNEYPIASQAIQICRGLVRVRNPVTFF